MPLGCLCGIRRKCLDCSAVASANISSWCPLPPPPPPLPLARCSPQIFLWRGSNCPASSRRTSILMAWEYLQHKLCEGVQQCWSVRVVDSGEEPLLFTCHFYGWEPVSCKQVCRNPPTHVASPLGVLIDCCGDVSGRTCSPSPILWSNVGNPFPSRARLKFPHWDVLWTENPPTHCFRQETSPIHAVGGVFCGAFFCVVLLYFPRTFPPPPLSPLWMSVLFFLSLFSLPHILCSGCTLDRYPPLSLVRDSLC